MYKPFLYIILLLLSFNLIAQNDTIQIQKLLDNAYSLESSSPKAALQLYQKIYGISLKSNYDLGVFKSLQYSGIVHNDNGRYDSALVYYEKSKSFCVKIKYPRGIASSYNNAANAHQFKGDYTNAAKNYLLGIKIFETLKDSAAISQSFQNLSAMYTNVKNPGLELLYLKKAIQFSKAANKEQIGLLYGDIGLTLLEQNRFNEALVYFKKTEELSRKDTSKRLLFFAKRNMGDYFNHIKQYTKAITYLESALLLSESQNDIFQKNDLFYILSGLYLESNNVKKSLEYAVQSLELAKKNSSKDILCRTQKRLSVIYNKLNQTQKAYSFLDESYTLRDSVLNENHIKHMALVQTQFETEKKDKSIAEQQVKLKKQELDLIKNKKEKQFYFIVSILLVVLSFGAWFFFRQRQKIKNKEILSLQQRQEITRLEALIDGEEKERRRIAQELHDGLNGDLSAIKYRLSTIEESGISGINAENLNKVIDMIDESCAQVRSISHNLMPTSILDYGLTDTIREFCRKINTSQAIKVDFQCFGNAIVLSKKNETVIYRIIQELVTNIIKHSKATEAMIQFNYRDDELFVTVEDNGVGFDRTGSYEGIGLKNIQSRVDFLKAQLDVDSSSAGTSYTISIDLNIVK